MKGEYFDYQVPMTSPPPAYFPLFYSYLGLSKQEDIVATALDLPPSQQQCSIEASGSSNQKSLSRLVSQAQQIQSLS